MNDQHDGKEALLQREKEFFDRDANSLSDSELVFPEDQLRRYQLARVAPLNTAKDRLFAELSPLTGKRVLDYGCGTGENACLFAACGATVTGFDLSPHSIEKARRRAVVNGLSDRTRFDVREAGATGYPPGRFDVVAGAKIIHHLHTELSRVYKEISDLLAPHGTACFIEPVANSRSLQKVRNHVPLDRDATPDERQLQYSDFEGLRSHFSDVKMYHFYCAERLVRVVGDRKWVQYPLRIFDHWVQRLIPFTMRFYGTLLVIARR